MKITDRTDLLLFNDPTPFKLNLNKDKKSDIKVSYITDEMEEQWRREGREDLLDFPMHTYPVGVKP